MAIKRHFMGWDRPVTENVRRFLLPAPPTGPVDLETVIIIAPTRQAGRRLRSALAGFCAEHDSALLSARVDVPSFFFRTETAGNEPNAARVKALWAETFTRLDPSRFRNFFPCHPTEPASTWAMQTGELVQRLIQSLSDGGLSIASIVQRFGNDLEEADRWRELAEIEAQYLRRLSSLGLSDPCQAKIARAQSPRIPDGVERVVIASVPDPSLLTLQALQCLAEHLTVDILIQAPPPMADAFDDWGRPLPDPWQNRTLDIPNPTANVILAGTPEDQSRHVLSLIATESHRYGPADIAVGVPDRAVAPFIATGLEEAGLTAFDPADKPLRGHPLFGLIEGVLGMLHGAPYSALASLLRHPDLLAYLKSDLSIPLDDLLTELDRFQNAFLPSDFKDVASRFPNGRFAGDSEAGSFDVLAQAVTFVAEQLKRFHRNSLPAALRAFLQQVYAARRLDSRNAEDQEWTVTARLIDDVLRELEDPAWNGELDADPAQASSLLLRRLGEQSHPPEAEEADIDLEGWLELQWNEAAFLIVTGMNEGSVPDSRLADVFLPDSLRARLGLRDDAERGARDAFLMTTFIESRRQLGRVCFIAGKTSTAGDPLKPSRLLLHCEDGDLTGRASCLFGSVPPGRESHPSSISFKLDPSLPPDLGPGDLAVSRLSVTAFSAYLACPFRFYLKYVLRMEALDDTKTSLDAMDFGSMVHAVLNDLANDDTYARCEDPVALASWLAERADRWIERRFGSTLSLPILVAREAARQRLAAAAAVLAEQTRCGWELVAAEQKIKAVIHGVTVVGRIDRVERHRDSGELRIIDFKTSDTGKIPARTHLAPDTANAPPYARVAVKGKLKRWTDLQLPLYHQLLAPRQTAPVRLAYFNLPKAVTHTTLEEWVDWDDALLASAAECAAEVARRVNAGLFWPPQDKVAYDDFEALFHGGIVENVEDNFVRANTPEAK